MLMTEILGTFIKPAAKRSKKLDAYVVSKTKVAAAQPKNKVTSKHYR